MVTLYEADVKLTYSLCVSPSLRAERTIVPPDFTLAAKGTVIKQLDIKNMKFRLVNESVTLPSV